jgi:hypothetical protein
MNFEKTLFEQTTYPVSDIQSICAQKSFLNLFAKRNENAVFLFWMEGGTI